MYDSKILEKRRILQTKFLKKGLFLAIFSGIFYGLASTFIALTLKRGIWDVWANTLNEFGQVFLISVLASAINDSICGLFAFINVARKKKLVDLKLTLNTKPAYIMIIASLIGGPIASVCFVIALNLAGSIAIPIAALNTAFGAILARVFLKQDLNIRMIFGIIICIIASFIIVYSSGLSLGKNITLGISMAFLAALGWAFEGIVASFGTSLIDLDISIVIRQMTSGLFSLIILFPLVNIIGLGNLNQYLNFILRATSDNTSIIFLIISGFCSLFAFAWWYKGNSMCGVALGMACNGAYAFWGPIFSYLIIGKIYQHSGYNLTPVLFLSAMLMVLGILIIAINPLRLLKRRKTSCDH